MTRRQRKLQAMVNFGSELATLSTCKAKACGCVLFPTDFSEVLAIGYNGPAMGQYNGACTAPQLQPGELARCGCIHAEANAVARSTQRRRGVMYSTTCPCPHCAGLAVNSRKVLAVVYDEKYWTDHGIMIMAAAGIAAWPTAKLLQDDGTLEALLVGADETNRRWG